MYYNKVEICGVNTSKLKTLSPEEKTDLLKKASEGDSFAREKLIDCNLRLVLSIVGRFANRGENMDDLFQVGCIGLIKAVDNFNTTLDVQFSTYAVPMIIGEIRRYLRDNNSVRVSRSLRDIAYKALSIREKLSNIMSQEPTLDDIEKEFSRIGEEHTKEEIACALEAITEPVSLFDPVYTDGSASDTIYIMDQISDIGSQSEGMTENLALEEAMKKLSERERMIILKRFFKGRTQTEIANEIGISQAQVSRLEKSAVDRIKKEMGR